jgi:N utilization substance protein B
MGTRRRSRELAMQALFYMDASQSLSEESLELYCRCFSPSQKALPFFKELVLGVLQWRTKIDALIEQFSQNWKMHRMAGVDRNILRIAVYEFMCLKSVPYKVTINEAIDIGKKFGTADSGAFINGILDSIRVALESQEITQSLEHNAEG